jgi:hypothetical protein
MKEQHLAMIAGIIFAIWILSIQKPLPDPKVTHTAQPSIELIDQVASTPIASSAKPTIIMHSRDRCPPCDSWWAAERPKWEAVGWSIDRITDENTSKLTPWYEIEDGDGQRFDVVGFMTADSFRKAKAGAK